MRAVGLGIVQGQGDSLKASNRVGFCYIIGGIRRAGVGRRRNHQFQFEAVGVDEGEVFLLKAFCGLIIRDVLLLKPFDPKIKRVGWDGESRFGGLTTAAASGGDPFPRKERQDGARVTGFVSKVKVIGTRVVEVDGFLDQSQSQRLRVKMQIALRIASDGGNVV